MRFYYLFILALFVLILLSWNAHASQSITYFYDGDTVKIKDGKQAYKLRISEIDAPERNQRHGKKSRRALMKLCKDASIKVVITGTDRYKRQLGHLYCNQASVSHYMVANGHAWFNAKYTNNEQLDTLQQTAKRNKVGLWQAAKPLPPWVWRKINRAAYQK